MAARDRADLRQGPWPDKARQPVHVPKAAELVAGTLRRQIVRGELSEGDALPSETSLMDFYGVSRPTLREALRVLEAERLIKVHRGSHGGARVQSPNGDVAARYAALVLEHQGASMADVYEARTIIEPPCARILAQRRTKGDLALLWASIAEAEAANETDNEDDVRAVRVQNDFHALIVGLAQNQTTAVLWGMLRHIIDSMIVSRVEREATHLGARSHRRLVELIESQDDEGAERLWRKHLTESSKFLTGGPGANTLLQLLD